MKDQPIESQVELVVAHHNSARAEIIMRITQRDSAVFLYLAATATIFGFAFNGAAKGSNAGGWDSLPLASLLFVPLLGLGATYIYTQHNDVIGALGQFLRSELDPYASRLLGSHTLVPPQWDSSQSLADLRSHLSSSRASSITLLLTPAVAALAICWVQLPRTGLVTAGWLAGVAAVIDSAFVLIRSHRYRNARLASLREARTKSQQPAPLPAPAPAGQETGVPPYETDVRREPQRFIEGGPGGRETS